MVNGWRCAPSAVDAVAPRWMRLQVSPIHQIPIRRPLRQLVPRCRAEELGLLVRRMQPVPDVQAVPQVRAAQPLGAADVQVGAVVVLRAGRSSSRSR